jgi:[acyl-carrier-protein] S-malonyltransferase
MTLAYLLGGGMNDQRGMGAELYDAYPVVRRWYADIEAWTGLTARQIIHEQLPESERGFRQGVGSLRQAAMAVGVHDVLADLGIRPAVIGGLSLGSMVGACLAGAVDRRPFIELLVRSRAAPDLPDDAPAQGIAVVTMPVSEGAEPQWWSDIPGVYPAVDLGAIGAGARRMVVLSGYREGLGAVALQAPPDVHVHIPEARSIAFHSPLQQQISDFLRPLVADTPFAAPAIALCSCLETKTLTTAEEVREMFLRNPIQQVAVRHLHTEMQRHGTRLALVLGPSQFDRIARPPFPVVHIEKPEDVAAAVAAIYELGIDLPGGGPR